MQTARQRLRFLSDFFFTTLLTPERQTQGTGPEKRERSPAAFDAYVKAEIARWAPVLKAAAEPAK